MENTNIETNQINAVCYTQYGVALEESASELTQGTMGFHFERDGSHYNH